MVKVIHGILVLQLAQDILAPARTIPCLSDSNSDHETWLISEVHNGQMKSVAELEQPAYFLASGHVQRRRDNSDAAFISILS